MDDILGILQSAGRTKGEELLQRYQGLGTLEDWEADDEALLCPFRLAGEAADKYHRRGFTDYRKELDAIVARVDEAFCVYKQSWRKHFDKKEQESPVKEKKRKSRKEKDVMLECAKKFAEPIHGLELIQNVEAIKASCAYTKQPRFSFHVAFRELCSLKAKSTQGGHIPTAQMFDEAKKINGSYLRALKLADEEPGRRA